LICGMGRTPHEVLGVQAGAPPEEIRRAFRRLARRLHPDKVAVRGPDAVAHATQKMRVILSAYNTLHPRRGAEQPVRPRPQASSDVAQCGPDLWEHGDFAEEVDLEASFWEEKLYSAGSAGLDFDNAEPIYFDEVELSSDEEPGAGGLDSEPESEEDEPENEEEMALALLRANHPELCTETTECLIDGGCPSCGEQKSVWVRVDRRHHSARVWCDRCRAGRGGSVADLATPIDVYCAWLDRETGQAALPGPGEQGSDRMALTYAGDEAGEPVRQRPRRTGFGRWGTATTWLTSEFGIRRPVAEKYSIIFTKQGWHSATAVLSASDELLVSLGIPGIDVKKLRRGPAEQAVPRQRMLVAL